MDLILLTFIVILLFRCVLCTRKPNSDYISREQTQCINGFFVLIVFMRHFKSYVELGRLDNVFSKIDSWSGQLIVVPFLFFSGYGIMLSITKKGKNYVNSIITKRFVRVWYHFALAVSLFIPVNIFLKQEMTLKQIVLSFIGWDGLGNSNWYIFDTLVLYLLTFISFKIFSKDNKKGLYLMFLLTCGFLAFMSRHKPGYWYNTSIAYPLGMIYAQIENNAGKWLKSDIFNRIIVLTVGAVLLVSSSFHKGAFTSYEMFVIGAILLLLVFSLKIRIGNKVLSFLGKYVFEIYILQRIPMLLLKEYIDNKYVLFAVSLAATLVISLLFRFVTDFLDSLPDRLTGNVKKKDKKAGTA